jgi:hypothetical protein
MIWCETQTVGRNKKPSLLFSLFVRLISHQPAVLFSQNKPASSNQPAVLFSKNKTATSNQPAVLFSQNKSAPAISHQPNEQAADLHVKTYCMWPINEGIKVFSCHH